MIRTTLSFLALFGSLFVVSKALTETQAQEKKPAAVESSSSRRSQPQPITVTRPATPAPKSDKADKADKAAAPGGEPSAEIASRSPASSQLPGARLSAPGGLKPSEHVPGLLPAGGDSKPLPTGQPGQRLALVPSSQLVAAPVTDAASGEPTLAEPITAAGGALAPAAPVSEPIPANEVAPARESTPDTAPAASANERAPRDPADDEPERAEPVAGTDGESRPSQRVYITIEDVDAAEPPATAAQPAEVPAELETQPEAARLPSTPPSAEPPVTDDVAPATVLSPEQLELRDKIRDVLAYHIRRHEQVERRSPWGIMHALIAYGVDTQVWAGDRSVNAIGWLCWNGPCRGQQLLYTENGRLQAHQGPGVQGHDGQFLAMLAQSKVKLDFPMRADGKSFTVADLVEYEKRTCQEGTELTFKLIGLSHYLDLEDRWKADSGATWDLQKLIKEELAQPVIGAACGGTHRMMGFSYSVKKREKAGLPMTGQWLRARKYVDSYHEYTFKLQNPDGSFSTNWFRGPGEYGTLERHLECTGHIAEWMVYSLSDEELLDPRTFRAVNFLATMMHTNLEHEWEIGPRGHALHALALYDERVFGGQPGKRGVELAEHRKAKAAR